MIELTKVLETIVKPIVTEPDMVVINEIVNGTEVLLQLNVAPQDMGRVIGSRGKIARAIRVIMKSAAISANLRVRVDIVDVNELDSKKTDI